jgi:hypothetical protein
MNKIAIIDTEELVKKYPKSIENLTKWLEKELGVGSGDLDPGTVKILAGYNSRVLYDFFDEYNINISIIKTDSFSYHINNKGEETGYDTRVDAEKKAFEEAFKIMENE